MRRTKESQKTHLLNELNYSGDNKKVIATRGSQALMRDYKNKSSKEFTISIFPLMGAWLFISFSLWFVFFQSLYILGFINITGFILIFFVKKMFIKEGKYQMISTFEKKKSLHESINEFSHLFNEEISKELADVSHNIEYLEKFFKQDLLSVEQEHYIQSCKEKHLIDLFKTLQSSHKEHLFVNQNNFLTQLKNMNTKLKNIIDGVQQVIDIKIKVKSAFTKE